MPSRYSRTREIKSIIRNSLANLARVNELLNHIEEDIEGLNDGYLKTKLLRALDNVDTNLATVEELLNDPNA